jgi:AcrB/AcrD/AcrF family
MSPMAAFIARPVATTLLTLGVALAGLLAYFQLPVAPLPQVEFPTISITASIPGASPETMAATVATPLERALGAISGVTEMTSYSTQSGSRITLQFELTRHIDSAARDVAAAIQAALPLLPSGMPSAPSYRKVNPADAPVLILSLTSDLLSRGELYDLSSTLLAQRLSQLEGVGQVNISGGALPAVRVELDPDRLLAQGLSIEDVRVAVVAHHGNRPKGMIDQGAQSWQIESNGQARKAVEFAPLVLRYRDGHAVRLSDVAEVLDSVQDIRNYGATNGKPAITMMIQKQPDANVLEVVERVRALLPQLQAGLPASVDLKVVSDRTPNLRASIFEMQKSLAVSVALVIVVVGLFLRRLRAAIIPSVAVPVSLAGAFGVMYLMGYSLNNLSLMALTIATGFVVDDAIVVLENISRRLEKGDSPREAALRGCGRHQPVADRGVHSGFADGGCAGATVSGVRCCAVCRHFDFDGRFAHHHPHDVCGVAAPRAYPSPVWALALATLVRPNAGLEPAPSAGAVADLAGCDCPQHQPLSSHSQGVFSAARHRAHFWLDPSRPKHFLSEHAAKARPLHRHRAHRPGRRRCDRLHGWLSTQLGLDVDQPQAARSARCQRRPGGGAIACPTGS